VLHHPGEPETNREQMEERAEGNDKT
jgi:hypothetical protein